LRALAEKYCVSDELDEITAEVTRPALEVSFPFLVSVAGVLPAPQSLEIATLENPEVRAVLPSAELAIEALVDE
jgi:hypothetical protein